MLGLCRVGWHLGLVILVFQLRWFYDSISSFPLWRKLPCTLHSVLYCVAQWCSLMKFAPSYVAQWKSIYLYVIVAEIVISSWQYEYQAFSICFLWHFSSSKMLMNFLSCAYFCRMILFNSCKHSERQDKLH